MPISFLYREAQINFKAIWMKWLVETEKYRQHKIMNSLKSLTFLLSCVSHTCASDEYFITPYGLIILPVNSIIYDSTHSVSVLLIM
jgi:hypothetical protein